MSKMVPLATHEACQARAGSIRSASFAAAGPTASHTGISFANVRGGSSSTAGKQQKGKNQSAAQLQERKRETALLGNL